LDWAAMDSLGEGGVSPFDEEFAAIANEKGAKGRGRFPSAS
jgi:hypothetical protein